MAVEACDGENTVVLVCRGGSRMGRGGTGGIISEENVVRALDEW